MTEKEDILFRQQVLLVFLWMISGLFGLSKVFNDSSNNSGVTEGHVNREYSVKTIEHSAMETRILRKDDVSVCRIWMAEKDIDDNFLLWMILVVGPLLSGPIFTVLLELCFYMFKKCSRSKHPETPSLMKYWIMLMAITLVILPSYSIQLWLTEGYFRQKLHLDFFISLLLKYFVGNCDLFLVPCIIIIFEPNMVRGLLYICRSRKQNDNSSNIAPTNV